MSSISLLALAAVLLFLPKSLGCSLTEDWRPISYRQRLVQAEIVVHAKVLNKTETPGYEDMWPHTYAGLFEVYCVLKGGPLQYNITVVEIGGPTTCSRTEVDVGEEYILLLTRREHDVLAPHEVNTQTAAIPATQDNLDMVALTCGLQNFTIPLGGAANLPEQRGCPTHPNESGEQCVYVGMASHVVMSTTLSLMSALLTRVFGLLEVAL
ncbi:coiled-coil domain-containing protein 3-like [Branchiostoma lanceolatum]|uniref:coiled-coil domain-containing protein 3-like n=1 Tax=Branchiostoma lanceolatum TaxID=7740 RepID=UPI003451AE6E